VSEKFIINLSAATFFSISLLWLPVLCFKLKISSSRSGLNLIEKPDIIATMKKNQKASRGALRAGGERATHCARVSKAASSDAAAAAAVNESANRGISCAVQYIM
jgi:hypothetical protein